MSDDYLKELRKRHQNGILSEGEYERALIAAVADGLIHVPEQCLPPMPDVPSPRKHSGHTYAFCTFLPVDFPSTSHREELLERAAAGEVIQIVNDLGLTATIYHASLQDEGKSLVGEGTIEGYTASEGRAYPEIQVFFDRKGFVSQLFYYESREDRKAHLAFPLWQPYYAWVEERDSHLIQYVKREVERMT